MAAGTADGGGERSEDAGLRRSLPYTPHCVSGPPPRDKLGEDLMPAMAQYLKSGITHRHLILRASAPPREIIYPTIGRPAQQALRNLVSRKGAKIFKRSPRNQTDAPIPNRSLKNLRGLCVKRKRELRTKMGNAATGIGTLDAGSQAN